ncbi:hypothetical protein Leryth_016242 [Lithospermum erythrorhizon]|nr:hypothetical protein Leryth_016242 [Lithospermum erythrorhizon]
MEKRNYSRMSVLFAEELFRLTTRVGIAWKQGPSSFKSSVFGIEWVYLVEALLSWFRRRLPWSKENGSGQLLWSRRLENHAFGNFSMAAIEANLPMEDRSVVNAGVNVTLVGVFDGHNDSLASSYVNSNLLEHLLLAASGGQPIEQAIESAFVRTEREFLDIVRESEEQYQRSATSCLVGVIWQGRLVLLPLQVIRGILGYLDTATNNIRSYELSSRHHTSSEVIRKELLDAHPNENKLFTEIEVNQRETLYLIKGSDWYPNYLLTPTSKPLIRADPEIRTRDIGNNDKFVIFGSAEFWKHLGDEKAVHIVHENARERLPT